jgi:hypothetical protein
MLRNPVEAFLSLHNHYILSLQEDLFDPEAAWRAQEARRAGRSLPFYCPHAGLLQYRGIFTYAPQVKAYLDRFGPDQVKVVILEELCADPEAGLASILEFLGADTDIRLGFERANSARQFVSPALARLLTAPPRPLGALMLAAKHSLNRLGIRPIHLLHTFTRDKPEAGAATEAFMTELRAAFEADVRQLEWLLDISLSDAWWPQGSGNETEPERPPVHEAPEAGPEERRVVGVASRRP